MNINQNNIKTSYREEEFNIKAYSDMLNRLEVFVVLPIREANELKFRVRHMEYGEELMMMCMERGTLMFKNAVDEPWYSMQSNIAAMIEARYL